jgi:hypothetical protein
VTCKIDIVKWLYLFSHLGSLIAVMQAGQTIQVAIQLLDVLNKLTDADGYPVRLLKAVAYVVPSGLSRAITEHYEQMEHDAVHKGVPHLALG